MNATLEQISPQTISLLEENAERFGLSVEEYLQSLLPKSEKDLALKPDTQEGEFETDMIAFAEESESLSEYKGDYSREDIYFDHD